MHTSRGLKYECFQLSTVQISVKIITHKNNRSLSWWSPAQSWLFPQIYVTKRTCSHRQVSEDHSANVQQFTRIKPWMSVRACMYVCVCLEYTNHLNMTRSLLMCTPKSTSLAPSKLVSVHHLIAIIIITVTSSAWLDRTRCCIYLRVRACVRVQSIDLDFDWMRSTHDLCANKT